MEVILPRQPHFSQSTFPSWISSVRNDSSRLLAVFMAAHFTELVSNNGSSFENQIEREQAARRWEIMNRLIALNQLLYSMQRRLHNDYDPATFEFKCSMKHAYLGPKWCSYIMC